MVGACADGGAAARAVAQGAGFEELRTCAGVYVPCHARAGFGALGHGATTLEVTLAVRVGFRTGVCAFCVCAQSVKT
jgi:hypothetical protein